MTADKDPGAGVEAAAARTLELAATWIGWDGKPRVSEEGDRIYTPHKAIRRQADHLLDHLAEIEAVLAGVATEPDKWHASQVTTHADFAPFTELDLDEARQRLTRLARTMRLRLLAAGPDEWDRPREGWTLREIAEHLSNSWYAEQVGDLSERHRSAGDRYAAVSGDVDAQ
jgi:DNA-binding transcriptional MerR regulator